MHKISTLSTIRPSERQQNDKNPTLDRPNQLLLTNKYSNQIMEIPRSGGEDRDRPDPQVSIQKNNSEPQ